MQYYLNPRNDIAFKKIFGDTDNKDILIQFLNDVLDQTGRGKITDVVLTNPAQPPEIITLKESILDVLCTDDTGARYIVEMQVSGSKGFAKRAQYYAAKAYSQQARVGQDYHSLKEVIFLAILDFVMFPSKPGYKSDHIILDKEDYSHTLKDFSFTFIELPKFTKKNPQELLTTEEKWCYFFKYAGDPEAMQHFLETISNAEGMIRKAYAVLEAHHWTAEELHTYDRMQQINMDMRAREAFVVENAEAKGMAIGIEQGIKQGIEQGIVKGRAAGITSVAEKLKILGLSEKKIAQATGLSEEEVAALH